MTTEQTLLRLTSQLEALRTSAHLEGRRAYQEAWQPVRNRIHGTKQTLSMKASERDFLDRALAKRAGQMQTLLRKIDRMAPLT